MVRQGFAGACGARSMGLLSLRSQPVFGSVLVRWIWARICHWYLAMPVLDLLQAVGEDGKRQGGPDEERGREETSVLHEGPM